MQGGLCSFATITGYLLEYFHHLNATPHEFYIVPIVFINLVIQVISANARVSMKVASICFSEQPE